VIAPDGGHGLVTRRTTSRCPVRIGGRQRARRLLLCAVALGQITAGVASAAAATSQVNWSGYLNGPALSSYQPGATAVRTGNAAALVASWSFLPAAPPIAALLNAATGTTVAIVSPKKRDDFTQPVFASDYLLVASTGQGIIAYQPKAG
jgi:hypothetical protein